MFYIARSPGDFNDIVKMMNEPKTILVVDDDPDILTIIRGNLVLDGYTVLTAQSGATALEQAETGAPDLVILDLMLPDMDGLQVCRAIRSKTRMPIIMLTAKDGVSDKVLGLETGADDYMVKPFDYLELAARIKVRLRSATTPAPADPDTVLTCGPLRLDLLHRKVFINGIQAELTPKEQAVLQLLVRHCGQVVPREQMINELWPDAGLYENTRTIDVHIQHLRAKIETDPADPKHLITHPGVGYMCQR